MESLLDIANEYGLELIETTSDRNGYPCDLKYAVIGFDTFDEAQELADRYGLTVRDFRKRGGWQLWVRGERMWEEYDYEQVMSEGYVNENVKTYRHNDAENVMSDLREQLQYASLCDMKILIENVEEVLEKLDDCQPDEFVVTCCGEYDATYLRKTMS